MPLMLTEVNAGRMSICDYVRWCVVQSGQDLGPLSAQGRDPAGRRRRHRAGRPRRARGPSTTPRLQSRSKISPWHGRAVKGLPLHTHRARPLRDARPRARSRTPAATAARCTRSSKCRRRDVAQCRQDHAAPCTRDVRSSAIDRERSMSNRQKRHRTTRPFVELEKVDADLWPRRQAGAGARRDQSDASGEGDFVALVGRPAAASRPSSSS